MGAMRAFTVVNVASTFTDDLAKLRQKYSRGTLVSDAIVVPGTS